MNRLALLKVLTLVLYAGPLLAGLAGHGWNVLPAFAAIFVLWQIVMRPEDWPRDAPGWREPGVIAGALARVVLMVVLVSVMFGIGRGIGGVAGHLAAIPASVALALSFLAVPLARLVWNPATDAEMGSFLDDAIARVNGLSAASEDPQAAATEIGPLLLLPDDAPDGPARAGVQAILAGGSTPLRLRALVDRLQAAPGRHIAARRGLILWATDRLVAERYIGCGMLSDAFTAAQGEGALEKLFADHALPVIVALPESWGDFPMTARVRQAAAEAVVPATARSLAVLADALDDAARRSGDIYAVPADLSDGRTDGAIATTAGHQDTPAASFATPSDLQAGTSGSLGSSQGAGGQSGEGSGGGNGD
ncbi:MAG: hypothetical protein ACK4L4_08030 [Gemmobacter sp.]